MKYFHVLQHSATEIIREVTTWWEFGISSILCPACISCGKKTEVVIFYTWFLFSCCFQGGVSGRLCCACALEPLGWTGQVQKGQIRTGAGPEKLGVTAGVPLSAQGIPHRLDRSCVSTALTASTNWELCTVPSPQPEEAGDTHQEVPPVPQNCTGHKALSPQGAGEEPTLSWGHPCSHRVGFGVCTA